MADIRDFCRNQNPDKAIHSFENPRKYLLFKKISELIVSAKQSLKMINSE